MRIANDAANDLRLYVPFTKREPQDDGSVVVSGIATAEEIDKQGECVAYEASKAAFSEWTDAFSRMTDGASLGNIREMHGPVAAGKAIAWEPLDDRKAIGLTARIYGDAAVKCKESVLNGFSIGAPGISVKREMRKDVPTITAYRLSEVSVVDNPAAPSATFTMVKRAEPITWTAGLVKSEIEAGRIHVEPFDKMAHADLAENLNAGHFLIDKDRYVVAKIAPAPPAPAKPLRKCWEIKRALEVRDEIAMLLSQEEYENAMNAPEPPEQLAALRDAKAALDRFIVSETQEQLGENADNASGSEDGDDEMKADELKALLDSQKDELTKAIGTIPTTDVLKAMLADLTKAAENAATKAAADAIAPVTSKLDGLEKRLDVVEKTPAAVQTVGAPIEKVLSPDTSSGPAASDALTAEDRLAMIEEMEKRNLLSDGERAAIRKAHATLLIMKK